MGVGPAIGLLLELARSLPEALRGLLGRLDGELASTTHDDAIEFPIPASWGLAANPGRQILPGELEMDGFYYARIVKQN